MNEIFCGKAEDVIKDFPDDLVNLIVTSPPYNVNLGKNKYKKDGYDFHEDNKNHDDYIQDMRTFFSNCKRILTNDARIVINIGDAKNGKITTHSDVIQMMKELHYIPYGIIIWNKKTTSNRCAWGSFKSPSQPSFPIPFEYILIFAKNSLKLEHKGKSDLTKDEFVKWSLAHWEFPPETRKEFEHPAPFPTELPKRCIKMLSYVDDVVLDPYCGTGTTCVTAKELNRKYIGIDISEKYCNYSKTRLRRIITDEWDSILS